MTSCAITKPAIDNDLLAKSAQFKEGKFHNAKDLEPMSFAKFPGYIKRYILEERVDITPTKPVPLAAITSDVFSATTSR